MVSTVHDFAGFRSRRLVSTTTDIVHQHLETPKEVRKHMVQNVFQIFKANNIFDYEILECSKKLI